METGPSTLLIGACRMASHSLCMSIIVLSVMVLLSFLAKISQEIISWHDDENIYDIMLRLTKSLWVNLPHKAACVILFFLISPDYYTRNAMVGSKERVCWICDRRFASGRALGGHQKSHYSLLPLPLKTRGQRLHVTSPDATLRSDTGNSIGRRSKHRHAAPTEDKESALGVTSGHEVLSDKEAARCLLMLSMGNGLVKKLSHGKSIIIDEAPTTEVVDQSSESSVIDDDCDVYDDDNYRKTFNCPYCEKMFGSAQGLGGHKRIHNRKATEPEPVDSPASVNNSKTYTIDLNLLPEPQDNND